MLRVTGWGGAEGVQVGQAVCSVDGPMIEVLRLATQAAEGSAPVLITGESGVGKELVAAVVHQHSGRPGPLVPLNCSALPRELAEAELFGHEKGAFTGAATRRAGAVERADRGTLFLDEIAELPLEQQPKLLRVLETRTVRRVGGETERGVDFRLVAATHAHLEELVARRRFRADLLYRLDVLSLRVPPLRERPDDVLLLAPRLLRSAGFTGAVTPGAMAALCDWPWPGNVRELRNVLVRAALLAGERIDRQRVQAALSTGPVRALEAAGSCREVPLQRRSHAVATRTLAAHGGNVSTAAAQLGVPRSTFYRWIRRGWVDRPCHRSSPVSWRSFGGGASLGSPAAAAANI